MKLIQQNALLILAASFHLLPTNAVPSGGKFRGGDKNDKFGGRDGPSKDFAGRLPGFDVDIELTDITCDDEFTCETKRDGAMGTFVCRGIFNPVTGVEKNRTLCIEPDEAWATDECGCCGDDCPVQPDFVPITCDEDVDLDFLNGLGSNVGKMRGQTAFNSQEDIEIVCRNLYNPFSGEQAPTTIPIKSDKSLDGDICGCCDDNCPERGDQLFPRPEFVNKTCEAEELVTCEIGKKRGDQDPITGQFVCRTTYNKITGDPQREPVCIPEDRAWESDECGCCGEDCPMPPRPVTIECTDPEDTCDLRKGGQGVFVCRTIFDIMDGEPEQVSLCIPNDRAWVSDGCGCCAETGCPAPPGADGFDDVDVQMQMLAVEMESAAVETPAGSSAHSFTANLKVVATFGLASLGFLGW